MYYNSYCNSCIGSNFKSNPKLFNTLLRVQARVRGMKVRDAVKVKSKRRYKSAKPSNSNQNTNSTNEEKFTNYFNKNPQALHSLIRVQSICRGILLRNQFFLKNQNGRNGVQYNGINNITTQNQQIVISYFLSFHIVSNRTSRPILKIHPSR